MKALATVLLDTLIHEAVHWLTTQIFWHFYKRATKAESMKAFEEYGKKYGLIHTWADWDDFIFPLGFYNNNIENGTIFINKLKLYTTNNEEGRTMEIFVWKQYCNAEIKKRKIIIEKYFIPRITTKKPEVKECIYPEFIEFKERRK